MKTMASSTRRFLIVGVLALAVAAFLVPTVQAEPFEQFVDCFLEGQVGHTAGTECPSNQAVTASVVGDIGAPASAVPVSDGGFSFRDAGIGAAVAIGGLILFGVASIGALIAHRRHRPVSA